MRASLLVALAACALAQDAAFGAEPPARNPMARVIGMLREMEETLRKEQKEDDEVHTKMRCWCDTVKRQTGQDNKVNSNARDREFSAARELSAKSGKLAAEAKNHKADAEAATKSLEKATALRKKTLAAFNEEEKDLLQSIQALKAALAVLKKHNTAFLQKGQLKQIRDAALILSYTMNAHKTNVNLKQRNLVSSLLLQDPNDSQSGEIYGILSQMLETFTANLKSAREEEAADLEAYNELKASKEEFIQGNLDDATRKEGELGETDQANAEAQENVANLKAQLESDAALQKERGDACENFSDDYEVRKNERNAEYQAILEAVNILTSDDAHAQFSGVFSKGEKLEPMLMQTRLDNARARAAKALSRFPALSMLSAHVKLDAFTKVIDMIDQMVADLKQQQQDDQEFRDRCVSELNENKRTTQETANNKQDTETEIAKLEAEIATLKSEIEQLAKDIAEARKNLKEASEDREVAHNEFKGILMNQRACIDTLKRATATLEKYYNTKKADQLIQARAEKATSMMEKESVMPAQPKGFDDMSRADSEKHLGTGNKILQLLREATTDAEKEMTTSKMDEANTQKNYETLVQELNTSIMDMTKTKTAKEETKADREKKLAQAEDRLEALVKDLATLENVRKEKTVHCRFIMENFAKRQKGRADEMEALAQAKSILRGSQSSA
jgi:hypothetical protein